MTTLRERNIAFFKTRDPAIFDIIESTLPTLSRDFLVCDADDLPVNIRLGEVMLYGKNEPAYSQTQVEDYFSAPNRLVFRNPDHCNISDVGFGLFRHMQNFSVGRVFPDDWLSDVQVVDSGYFFCSGIGLGHHIREIVEKSTVRIFVFSEPVVEFFIFSLDVVDWEKVYDIAKSKEADVKLIIGGNASEIAYGFEQVIYFYGASFLEGSYFYAHYGSWDVQETLNLLRSRMENYMISSGFYEDEILMTTNTYYNFKHSKFRYLKNSRVLEQSYPVFVIGSGPSLEYSLEDIKKWRDRAVVISCGTTIRLLLKNGIRPDIHVENENGWKTEEILRTVKEEYGLEGIILACSSTVFPGVQKLFDEVWIYMRQVLSSTQIFAKPDHAILGAGPMVVNAGASVAYNLGFRKIYLFGADCGKAEGGASHHKDALYHDALGKKLGFTKESLDKVYIRKVPGNFGGEFWTSHFLDMSRICLADMKRRGASLVNCSRGAKIEGVPAQSGASINLEAVAVGRQADVLGSIRNQFALIEPGEKVEAAHLEQWQKACPAFKKALSEKLEPLMGEVDNFWEVDKALNELWHDKYEEFKGILTIISGSYINMIRLASFLGSRIKDEDIRKEFIAYCLEKYIEICHWMADELEGLYQDMTNGVDRVTIPEPYEGGFEYHRKLAEEEKLRLAEQG